MGKKRTGKQEVNKMITSVIHLRGTLIGDFDEGRRWDSLDHSLIHRLAAVRIIYRSLICFDLILMWVSYSDYFIGVGPGQLKFL